MNKKFYKISSKNSFYLSPLQHEIIIGSMLGDLTAEKRNINSNTRLHFKQSLKNKEYIYHLYDIFKDFCGSTPNVMSKFDYRPNKMKEYKSIKFQTLTSSCFNIYKEIFYNSERKIVPNNIFDLLTPIGLAYWIMDDGYKSNKGIYISTESFSKEELILVKEVLKNKFNLESGIHLTTNGYRIYIFSSSREKLINLIKPYFLSLFNYKLYL
jgi:LAGLIDADG DNA endonuclease family